MQHVVHEGPGHGHVGGAYRDVGLVGGGLVRSGGRLTVFTCVGCAPAEPVEFPGKETIDNNHDYCFDNYRYYVSYRDIKNMYSFKCYTV